jgi:predicted PurR-regulated permease PerM
MSYHERLMSNSDNKIETIPWLSPTQQRLAGLAVAAISLTVLTLFVLALFSLARDFIVTFTPVLWPLAVAGILALILKPAVLSCEERLRTSRPFAISLIYLLFVGVLVLTLTLVLPVVLDQLFRLIDDFPGILKSAQSFLAAKVPYAEQVMERLGRISTAEWGARLEKEFQRLGPVLLNAVREAGTWINGFLLFFTGTLLVPIYLIFFLMMDHNPLPRLQEQVAFIDKRLREDLSFLAEQFVRMVVAYFRGQVIIALILAVLFSMGFFIIDLRFSLLLGTLVGLLNLVPFLGTIFAVVVVLPMAFLQPDGGLLTLGMAVLVLGVIQLTQDYFLTPRIQGKETGLHPMVIIVSLFFWGTALGGILGMILAIPLTAFLFAAWRVVLRRYLEQFLQPSQNSG